MACGQARSRPKRSEGHPKHLCKLEKAEHIISLRFITMCAVVKLKNAVEKGNVCNKKCRDSGQNYDLCAVNQVLFSCQSSANMPSENVSLDFDGNSKDQGPANFKQNIREPCRISRNQNCSLITRHGDPGMIIQHGNPSMVIQHGDPNKDNPNMVIPACCPTQCGQSYSIVLTALCL